MPTNSKESVNAHSQPDSSSCYFDPSTLKNSKKPGYFHKLDALKYVHFKRPASDGHQYLDIGCGSGGFTRDALLEKVHPCRRIVAVDREDILLEYARQYASHPDISYELFDIEKDDPLPLIEKNMFRLLKDGGEAALVALTGSVITDIMHQLRSTEPWKDYVPDPTTFYSERFFFNAPIAAEAVEEAERVAAAAAGLNLVSCTVYDSQWIMPDVDAWIDLYVPVFKLDAQIPEGKRDAFRNDCRALLQQKTTSTDRGLRHETQFCRRPLGESLQKMARMLSLFQLKTLP
ncbi:hypothetical protein MTO96_035094 [Rhipicephalus appendiculatus]